MSTNSTRNFIPMQHKYDRVVLLVDMDCFYCQVEEKLDPQLKGKPIAVVQYNAWRGGGIIAVNYPARAKGVTRHMRGDEAREQCPDIQLVKVPNVREKADLSKYRDAGKEVANVLQRYTKLLERASVDEAYLDITEAVNKRLEELHAGTFILQPQGLMNTYAVGYKNIGEYLTTITSTFMSTPPNDYSDMNISESDAKIMNSVRQSDIRLLVGASLASEIRADVKATTGYECSAGIAHNKILAKLVCGVNKPNKQTILPLTQTAKYLENLSIRKIKGLGGKYGDEVSERLNVQTFGQMLKFTENELQRKFDEKNGTWLYYICRGIDLEAVTPRFYSKSIGCCKKFPGMNNITGLKTLKHWLQELASEISDRLDKDIFENNRKAKQMVVSFVQDVNGKEISSSRSAPLLSYERDALAQQCLDVVRTNTKLFIRPGSDGVLNNAIRFLGISVGKFESISNSQNTLEGMFASTAMKNAKNKTQAGNIENTQPEETVLQGDYSEAEQQEASNATESQLESKPEETKTAKDEESKSFLLKYLKKGADASMVNQQPAAQVGQAAISVTESSNNEDAKANPREESFFMKILKKQQAANEGVTKDEANSSAEQSAAKAEQPCEHPKTHSATADDDKPSTSKRKYEEIKEDFRETYAEFAMPDVSNLLLETIPCEICGKDIVKTDIAIQTHKDYHFAQQLSQKQREEYRAEVKSKITATSPKANNNNKKAKITNNKSKQKQETYPKASNVDIKQFLRPKLETVNVADASQNVLDVMPVMVIDDNAYSICQECGKSIAASDMLNHQDYHVALRLQRELNQSERANTVVTTKTTTTPASAKKTRTPQRRKPLDQFFLTKS